MRPTRTLKEFFEKGDVLLLSLCIIASLMGLVLIYSATQYREVLQNNTAKQAFFICLGIAAYVWVTFIDIEYMMKKWWRVFLLQGIAAILTIIPWATDDATGNRRLVFLPVIAQYFGFQPGWIAKLS